MSRGLRRITEKLRSENINENYSKKNAPIQKYTHDIINSQALEKSEYMEFIFIK